VNAWLLEVPGLGKLRVGIGSSHLGKPTAAGGEFVAQADRHPYEVPSGKGQLEFCD